MADAPTQCKDLRDDYFECLFHTKEIRRAKIIQAVRREKQKQT
jgi:hypothetical protein